MALIADIRVNDHYIGRVIAVRKEGGIGEMNKYEVSGFTMPHPTTGEEIDVRSVPVEHHYNDSPITLMAKAFEAIRAFEARKLRPSSGVD